ncbi:hypothetical protein SDC9_158512 [bioreactor metagenome]|uniref:Uncharacterized protein n=1 Tax=bioreactor metagenome TaxID=1076179 RepID=A0A645FA75_9ZZZZ|nr:DUF523 domain-containing protein [Erysipelotrichaceae bacterium]
MKKILISACLVGDKTRYDEKSNYNPLVKSLMERYELVPFCPEVEGGLSTPREPSEIVKDKVFMKDGKNVTRNFMKGAELAWNICNYLGIDIAILKDGSPSCGVHEVYNGKFENKKIKGKGITTAYLMSKGVRVISENELEDFVKEK